jgi:hypothetical protein
MCQRMDLINSLNEALHTIRILSGLAPVLDGNPEHFESALELMSLIHQHAGHAGVHTTFVQKQSLVYYTHNFSSTPCA